MNEQIEKQAIEEMAYSVCRMENKPANCASCMWKVSCENYLSAENYYNAGYRKQEWISVEDRLPPKNKMVLIFCGGVRELDWICSTGLWYDHDYTLVTHWMPLPEPPSNIEVKDYPPYLDRPKKGGAE